MHTLGSALGTAPGVAGVGPSTGPGTITISPGCAHPWGQLLDESTGREPPTARETAGVRAMTVLPGRPRTVDSRPVGTAPGYCRARLLMRAVSSVTCVYVARRSLIRLVIFLTACMTVVWSLPPKEAPIRGRDSSVSSRHRYMAI